MAERILTGAIHLLTILGALALAVMMLSTDYDILARLLFNQPLRGVVELVEITVLASAMLALPETFLRDEQIRVDLVDSFLPISVIAALKSLGLVLTITFLAILCYHVYQPMIDARRFGDVKPELGVPLYALYALIMLSFAASVLACGLALRRAWTDTDQPPSPPGAFE